MKSLSDCQVIIIDSPDGHISAVASRVLPQAGLTRCQNVYQATALMFKHPGQAVVIIAEFQKLVAEKMRFFELIAQRPRCLCCCLLRTETAGFDTQPIPAPGSSVFWVPDINGLASVLHSQIRPLIEKPATPFIPEDKPLQQSNNPALLSNEELQALLGK